ILVAFASLFPLPASHAQAPERLDRGRFTFQFFAPDRPLATTLADHAIATDTFPGLPRPSQRVTVVIAPDQRRFRELAGDAPEWGSAVAFPQSRRVVLQGRRAGSDAGDPLTVLRHELAHLALHEHLGDLPRRWFDEGYASYAAREWGREEVLATNVALALRGMPTLDELEASFAGGSTAAQSAYALAYRAVSDLANQDARRGLALLFEYWRETGSFERGLRRAYGLTSADFEKRWRDRTRSQYGFLALASNLTFASLLLLFLLMPLYMARKRRDRRRLERMREADAAAERAEQQSAIDELLGGS
ncbi:MAG: peptidase MA family metallohydrolase, partial [Gemmatimonadaceae bacterium]